MMRRARRRRLSEAMLLRLRLGVFGLAAGVLFSVLAAQLWRLQVAHGEQYREQAELNRLRVLVTTPARGLVFDRKGRPLVRNVPSFSVGVVPADLPEDEVAETLVLSRLSRILGLPLADIQAALATARGEQRLFEPMRLKDGIKRDEALLIEERQAELPGVLVQAEAQRDYPEGELVSHVVGYTGRITEEQYGSLRQESYGLSDRLGQAGVEASYEATLRGAPGTEVVEVNAYGRTMRTLAARPAQSGSNVVLGLDLELQQAMTQALREGMGRSRWGVAIAVAPKTGEVLGMVSLPTYNDNVFSGGSAGDEVSALLSDRNSPLWNRAVGAVAPPGSIFKVVVGSAALQAGVANANTTIVSTGQISLVSAFDPSVVYVFRDWAAHGALNFYQGIARSSDVYFYYLAGGYQDFRGLGVERLASYARAFGFGERLGIDLPGEAAGTLPDPAWKQATWQEPWFIGDTYNLGIGQGFLLVTPLQMLMAASVIANGGELLQPRVVREVVNASGEVVTPSDKHVIRQVPVDPRHLATVRTAMWMAVEPGGTATLAAVPGVRVAGKTGTAEYAGPVEADGSLPTHGWFLGFAPVEDPQIAVVVFVESGRGAQTAAPIAGRIFRAFFGKEQPRTSGVVGAR